MPQHAWCSAIQHCGISLSTYDKILSLPISIFLCKYFPISIFLCKYVSQHPSTLGLLSRKGLRSPSGRLLSNMYNHYLDSEEPGCTASAKHFAIMKFNLIIYFSRPLHSHFKWIMETYTAMKKNIAIK